MVSRWHRKPKRGDIIAFQAPKASAEGVYLKRVVGFGGDTLEVSTSTLSANGKQVTATRKLGSCAFAAECELREESIYDTTYSIMLTYKGSAQQDSQTVFVPTGTVFVLGDNRDNSVDSRTFGPVPLQNIIGRYQFTWFSSEIAGE